jgi:hypothetical protein
MRHIKLYENKTVNSVRHTIIEFKNLLKYLRPEVISLYNKLAEDDEYEPNFGDKPFITDDDLILKNIGYWSDGVQFNIEIYDDDGFVSHSFYPEISNDELEEMLMRLDSKKYNL